MKQLKRKGLAVILLITMAFSLTGCSLGFDASGYVKACLDACTKGEVTEYAKLTNSSEEEALELYNSFIDADIDSMSSFNMTDEMEAKYRQLYIDIYKNMSYEVGEAVSNSDGSYTVPVTTKKLMIFDGVNSSTEEYITDWAKNNSSASMDEIYAAILDYMYDELSTNLNAKNYEDNEVYNVSITKTSDGVYQISDSDLQNLINMMLDIENAG